MWETLHHHIWQHFQAFFPLCSMNASKTRDKLVPFRQRQETMVNAVLSIQKSFQNGLLHTNLGQKPILTKCMSIMIKLPEFSSPKYSSKSVCLVLHISLLKL